MRVYTVQSSYSNHVDREVISGQKTAIIDLVYTCTLRQFVCAINNGKRIKHEKRQGNKMSVPKCFITGIKRKNVEKNQR